MLYGTSACHLCEQAEAILLPWVAQGMTVALVDIAEDDRLFDQFSVLIPVLQREDGKCLSWPFDRLLIEQFLSNGPSPA